MKLALDVTNFSEAVLVAGGIEEPWHNNDVSCPSPNPKPERVPGPQPAA